jgi:murein DD-endopeptidase MepM/ murein hydrolase activator NlpD
LVLSSFNPELTSFDVHGAIACITYQGNTSDLIGLNLEANVSQGGNVVDGQILIEEINGRKCFELVDAKYTSGQPVSIEITASGNMNKVLKNNKQEFDLGNYLQPPFFRWIFGENSMDNNVFAGYNNGHPQWDLKFSSNDYLNGLGTPVYAIGDGNIVLYNYWYPKGEENGYCVGVYQWLPEVGLAIIYGHIAPGNYGGENQFIEKGGVSFKAGEKLGTIDATQKSCASEPHVHLGIQTANPNLHDAIYSQPVDTWINPFSSDPFKDGINLPTGLWLPEYLPEKVTELISSGFFKNNMTFTNYSPVHTK